MSTLSLTEILDLIQVDVGKRGLRTDPHDNLITASAGDFESACQSLAETTDPAVAIVTGFFIPHADPPSSETDGPLGALFLARALAPLGIKVVLVTDEFCRPALEAGIGACGLRKSVPLIVLPTLADAASLSTDAYWDWFAERAGRLTHLVALERVGPSHTPATIKAQAGENAALVEQFLRQVPESSFNCCHTMNGRDITAQMSPAHHLFHAIHQGQLPITTIGIGDGGNEIGMGKVSWDTIRRNIPGGAKVACRTATDHLIVCGVSNWGGYGLAVGARQLLGQPLEEDFFDMEQERRLLQVMVEKGPLVDGVTGQPTATVDGLSFEHYIEPLCRMGGKQEIIQARASGDPEASDPSPQPGASRPPLTCSAPAADVSAWRHLTGSEVRRWAASGQFQGPTPGLALGYVQANLVIVPRQLAFDFLLFCQRNPKPCPLLDVTDPGSPEPKLIAPGADVRTDVSRYCVYRDGELVDEPTDLHAYWRDDLVAFLIGCSFTFENALMQGRVPVRHIQEGRNVPMYRTNIPCRPAGVFHGPMVVSMRPMTPAQAIEATIICQKFTQAHGAPVHFGDPAAIGITDIHHPDFGDPVTIHSNEVPVFWACGVTPQVVAMAAKPSLMITHKPGHMFVTDIMDHELAE